MFGCRPSAMVQAANAALHMECTPFAIDAAAAQDGDEEEEEDLEGTGAGAEDDDHVMDGVDAFLEEHDSGLTDACGPAAFDPKMLSRPITAGRRRAQRPSQRSSPAISCSTLRSNRATPP